MIDLHTHSNKSDGTLTPTEIIKLAKLKNLKALALTDHDTIDGLYEASTQAKISNIEFINGIEISSKIKNLEIHILGLFIDPNNLELKEYTYNLQNNRKIRNKKILEKLLYNDININYENMVQKYNTNLITRIHFANEIIKQGYAKNKKEAFNKYLGEKGKAYIPFEEINCKDAISIIHKSNGIAILAHPFSYKLNFQKTEELILSLKEEYKLDGIEAIYTSHRYDEEWFLRNLSRKYNLKISGGSDFHGNNKPTIYIGCGFGNLKINDTILENLKKEL